MYSQLSLNGQLYKMDTRGGGPCRNFWVGMCRGDRGTLDLHQSYFS